MRTRRNCGWRSEIGEVLSVSRPDENGSKILEKSWSKGLTIFGCRGMIRGCRWKRRV